MHFHKFDQKFIIAHIGKLTTSTSSRDKEHPPKPSKPIWLWKHVPCATKSSDCNLNNKKVHDVYLA